MLNDPEGLGLVEEVDQLQELLQGELVQRRLVTGHVVVWYCKRKSKFNHCKKYIKFNHWAKND
jgi:hypothetical protein